MIDILLKSGFAHQVVCMDFQRVCLTLELLILFTENERVPLLTVVRLR